jgi:hypothetical protein
MRLSRRSLRLGLCLLGVVAMVVAVAAVLVPSGLMSHAAPKAVAVRYTGKVGAVTKGASAATAPTNPGATSSNTKSPKIFTQLRVPHTAGAAAAATVKGSIPHVASGSTVTEGSVLHNFNGLSNLGQENVNGGPLGTLTPPDQGICAGFDALRTGNPAVVWEPINSAVAEYTPSGKLLAGPFSFAQFFEPNAFSDPRCFYDTATNTFFFTVISSASFGGNDSFDDIVVMNANGVALYQVSTSLGGTCFGDQPKAGYDSNLFYIATDQFCNTGYLGELLIGVDKAKLVAEANSVATVSFGDPTPLTIGGIPVLGQEPAFGDPSPTEYLLNSFPYDAFGNNNSVENLLGFWKVTGDNNIGKATLTGKIISSETYGFTVNAQSTGNGSQKCVHFPVLVNCGSSGLIVTSETFLNPDDDRMLQVQLVNDAQNGLQLYASLSTALTVGNDPTNRDGAAWFVLNPSTGSITSQGYVGVAGAYMLYPAIVHTTNGTTTMTFTVTSPTINPKAAYTVATANSNSFSSVKTIAAGAGPHLSFADALGQVRWGDYSACELDPNNIDMWCATEYIPPKTDQSKYDNWGTRVFEVQGA